jgi:hypothetical protein
MANRTQAQMLNHARSQLYRAARDTGDVQAALRGPQALSKRYVRRVVYRNFNRQLGRTLRGFGL